MAFKSVDEIFNFDFQDATVNNVKINDEGISFNLEALIVESENSQNENFTKSYAGTTKVKLESGKIISAIRDGYRQYDANDKLINEVEDTVLDKDQAKLIFKNVNGAYLYAMDLCPESTDELFVYNICIEFPNEEEYDTSVTKSYQFKVSFIHSTFSWDNYMNRVQS